MEFQPPYNQPWTALDTDLHRGRVLKTCLFKKGGVTLEPVRLPLPCPEAQLKASLAICKACSYEMLRLQDQS